MRFLLLAISILAPLHAGSEEEIPFSRLLSEVTVEQPICFGREYSDSHLRAHPLQTVALFRAKLSKQEGSDGSFLEVEMVRKGEKLRHKLWRQFLLCEDNGRCAVECDGGSVTLSGTPGGGLGLRNDRFVIEGGCEGGAEPVMLDNKRGGDDFFRLHRLPQEYCASGR